MDPNNPNPTPAPATPPATPPAAGTDPNNPTPTPGGAQPHSEPSPGEGGQPAPAAGAQSDPNNPDPKPGEGEGDGKKGEGDEPKGAPEKYELELPEGMQIDEALMGEFEPVLRELDLTNEQASKLAVLVPKIQEHQAAAWAKQVDAWEQSVNADPDLGGANLAETTEVCKKALAAFGSEELTQYLDETGFGNHPALVKFVHKVGKSLTEDSMIPGNPSGGTKKSFYQNSDHK